MFYSKVRFRIPARKELVTHPKAYPASIKDMVYSMVLEPDETRGDSHFVYRFDQNPTCPVLTIVSQRRPLVQNSDKFEVETKEYDPTLSQGQRLQIRSKVNATRKKNGVRRDIVQLMKWQANDEGLELDALPQRLTMAQEAGQTWLEKQGRIRGFDVEECQACDYGRHENFHPHIPALSYIDIEATIEVRDPEKVQSLLTKGFGKSKGFGYGLVEARPVQ